jgi:hypothetical protein
MAYYSAVKKMSKILRISIIRVLLSSRLYGAGAKLPMTVIFGFPRGICGDVRKSSDWRNIKMSLKDIPERPRIKWHRNKGILPPLFTKRIESLYCFKPFQHGNGYQAETLP